MGINFRLWCAIWAHKEWVGDLFPPGSRATDFLHLYSRRFTTVEGNTTFYSIPDRPTVERWATETPPGFEFCLKLPRSITHQGLLVPKIGEAVAFLDRMSLLGDRLGPLFLQLPPGYSPAFQDDLTTFLQSWPSDRASLAVEVRHPHWFQERDERALNQALSQLGIGRVLLDSRPIYDCDDDPQLVSERRKPKLPLHPVITADFGLIRYISHPDASLNRAFLEEWVPLIGQWLAQGKRIYFFVHCPVEERSPANARQMQRALEHEGILVPPLPWDELDISLDSAPTQLSLF